MFPMKQTSKKFKRKSFLNKSAGTVEYTDGDSNKTSVKKHKSMKSEAQPIANGVGG